MMLATLDHFLRRRGGRGSWFTKPEAYVCVCQSVLSLLALLVTVACHWSRISSFPCRAPPRVCVVRGSSCGISCRFTINIKLVPFSTFYFVTALSLWMLADTLCAVYGEALFVPTVSFRLSPFFFTFFPTLPSPLFPSPPC